MNADRHSKMKGRSSKLLDSNQLSKKDVLEASDVAAIRIGGDAVGGDKINARTAITVKGNIEGEIHIHNETDQSSSTNYTEEDYASFIKQQQKEIAENCKIDNVIYDDFVVPIAPLQITNDVQHNKDGFHFHHRGERAEILKKPPVGDVTVEELFIKAKELAQYQADSKNFLKQPKARAKFIETHSNIVGIIGQAGCGKTTLSKTILGRVIGEECLYGAEIVFYVQFRNINYAKETNVLKFLSPTLSGDWMKNRERRNSVLNRIQNSDKVLIITDGLDETEIDFTKDNHKISCDDEDTIGGFLKNILSGTILSKAKKLILSRPRQMMELSDEHRPHFLVNILGLDQNAQKQICQDICGKTCDQVYKYIQNYPDLSAYSHIPINCILTVFSINEILKSDNFDSILPPQSMTGILASVLALFINSPHLHGEFDAESISALAWLGFKSQKVIFQKKDLKESKLSDNAVENMFVTVSENRKLCLFGGNPKIVSYFSHLILQEFFVALHLLIFMPIKRFQQLFFSDDSTKPQFDLTSSRFEMVTKFMFGLCNEATFQVLEESISSCTFPCEKSNLLQNLPQATTYKNIDNDVLRYFTWAYELQNDAFTLKLACRLNDEVDMECQMLPSDFAAFHSVFNMKQQQVTIRTLSRENFYGDCWQDFCSDPKWMVSLIKIEKLILNANKVGDKVVPLISSCIQRVENLCLNSTAFTKDGIKSLQDLLKSSDHKIKSLYLQENKFGNEGAVQLSKCLSVVEGLWIRGCDVTVIGIQHMCEELIKLDHKMKELNVRGNEFGDEGAVELSKCLHKLESLGVEFCGVTLTGVRSIADKLMTPNFKIKKLLLNHNKFGDQGAIYLAKCIHNVDSLQIKFCDITLHGMKSISTEIMKFEHKMECLEATVSNASDDDLQKIREECREKVKHLNIYTDVCED